MDWLARVLSADNIATILVTALVGLATGFISSLVAFRFRRREIVEAAAAELSNQRALQTVEAEAAREERLRQELIRWANPILGAVYDLESRLHNLLHSGGHLALSPQTVGRVNPNWSISYEYMMQSTLYLFGQYFAWVQLFEQEISFELFGTQETKDAFRVKVREVERCLAAFPPRRYDCEGKDAQLFALQQRAIGQSLIVSDGGSSRCSTYPEFVEQLAGSEPTFEQHFDPLKALLLGLNRDPADECCWKRLDATLQALSDLKVHCERLLHVPASSTQERDTPSN